MRFWAPLLAFAALAFAQSHNQINTPNGGFGATAGQSITITWTNPSDGNVDIRLTQGSNIQPGAGVLLITVPASQGTATFTLPDGASLNGQQYNFEIVPVDDPSAPNFSSPFVVSGASGTGSTTDSSSMTATSTDSSSTASASASATSTDSNSSSSTDSASASAAATSSGSASSSSATAATTTAAHNMGASSHQIGGVLAMVAGALAVF